VDPSPENTQQRQTGIKTLFRQMLAEEMLVIQERVGEHRFSSGRFDDAARLMEQSPPR
jgi:malate synthase